MYLYTLERDGKRWVIRKNGGVVAVYQQWEFWPAWWHYVNLRG
jgi:hypothetical protein